MFKIPLDATTATTVRSLLQQIRGLLLEGQVENALRTGYNQLAPYLDIDPLANMLSTWNQAERNRLQQLITQDKFDVSRAKVTALLQHFLDDVTAALGEARAKDVELEETISGDSSPPVFPGQQQILVLYAAADLAIWRDLQKHFFLLQKMESLHWSDALQDKPTDLEDDFAYLTQWVDVSARVLCLVTPNTLGYPTYPLAERAAAASKLIPLKLIEVDLAGTIFAPLGSLPSDNRFVSQWPDENAAYVDIAQQLRRFLQNLARG